MRRCEVFSFVFCVWVWIRYLRADSITGTPWNLSEFVKNAARKFPPGVWPRAASTRAAIRRALCRIRHNPFTCHEWWPQFVSVVGSCDVLPFSAPAYFAMRATCVSSFMSQKLTYFLVMTDSSGHSKTKILLRKRRGYIVIFKWEARLKFLDYRVRILRAQVWRNRQRK